MWEISSPIYSRAGLRSRKYSESETLLPGVCKISRHTLALPESNLCPSSGFSLAEYCGGVQSFQTLPKLQSYLPPSFFALRIFCPGQSEGGALISRLTATGVAVLKDSGLVTPRYWGPTQETWMSYNHKCPPSIVA